MMRLVENGLMFGNLIEVSSKGLVARYNRALKHLTGRETALTEFHIDISGYSPEIGHELDDELYLNPKGCNRQFILMSPEQKTAPLLDAQFSTSRDILKKYIIENESEIFALTAREAVAGELLNSVHEIAKPEDILKINRISIEADTIGEHVANAAVLQDKIDDFLSRPDAWWDDVLIADMINMANQTGNIERNPLNLSTGEFSQSSFYTPHFGGVYVFRDMKTRRRIGGTKPFQYENAIEVLQDVDGTLAISRTQTEQLAQLPVDTALSFNDRAQIAAYLHNNELADMIVSGPSDRLAPILKQKMDFIAISTAASLGDDLESLSRHNLRHIERKYLSDMPEAYHGLSQLWRWASMGGTFPQINSSHGAYFYLLRATNHPQRDLINMLLADLSPLDFRQLFICHKEAFYNAYSNYPEAKKTYVSRFLTEEYAIDKAGARETLFGRELAMDNGVDDGAFKGNDISGTTRAWRTFQNNIIKEDR